MTVSQECETDQLSFFIIFLSVPHPCCELKYLNGLVIIGLSRFERRHGEIDTVNEARSLILKLQEEMLSKEKLGNFPKW